MFMAVWVGHKQERGFWAGNKGSYKRWDKQKGREHMVRRQSENESLRGEKRTGRREGRQTWEGCGRGEWMGTKYNSTDIWLCYKENHYLYANLKIMKYIFKYW